MNCKWQMDLEVNFAGIKEISGYGYEVKKLSCPVIRTDRKLYVLLYDEPSDR